MALDLEDKLSQAHRTTVILAVAMIASVFVYAGIVELLPHLAPGSAPAAEPGTVGLLRKVFRGLDQRATGSERTTARCANSSGVFTRLSSRRAGGSE